MAKVMCIDDDLDVIQTCSMIFKSAKHNVETASSGKEGYAKAKAFKPDLIVLDVMMDDATDGFHTAYEIRQDESLRYTPILMLTSVNQKTGLKFNPEKDGNFLPVDAFIEKPIDKKLLLNEAQRLLKLNRNEINVG